MTPVILHEMTDEQMLKYMGRENTEDYNADFMVMLETWEAAENFLWPLGEAQIPPDIARLLGWVRPHPQRDIDMTDDCAEACSAASQLIRGRYLKREEPDRSEGSGEG